MTEHAVKEYLKVCCYIVLSLTYIKIKLQACA